MSEPLSNGFCIKNKEKLLRKSKSKRFKHSIQLISVANTTHWPRNRECLINGTAGPCSFRLVCRRSHVLPSRTDYVQVPLNYDTTLRLSDSNIYCVSLVEVGCIQRMGKGKLCRWRCWPRNSDITSRSPYYRVLCRAYRRLCYSGTVYASYIIRKH